MARRAEHRHQLDAGQDMPARKDAVNAFYAAALDPLDGKLLVQMTGFQDELFFF